MADAQQDHPVLVTTAKRSLQQDRHDRERRYLITMGIRVVAIIVAIVVARGWIRAVAVVLAVVLPWIAVVAANSGPKRRASETPSLYVRRKRRELE